jgi:hypothetical protein
MLYNSVTIVVTGLFASWAQHLTQLQSARVGAAWLVSQCARQRYFSPQKHRLCCVHSEHQALCTLLEWAQNTWQWVSSVSALVPATALTLGPKRAVWSLLDRLHCFLIYPSICKTLLVTEVISLGVAWQGGGGGGKTPLRNIQAFKTYTVLLQ